MSKLKVVRQALESNPDVVIVNVDERNYLPERSGFWSHTVDYWIAPKEGLYTRDQLQAFMMGLVPNLEPSSKDDFFQNSNTNELRFGKLYFDENIGEERTITKRILTLIDKELFNTIEKVGDQWVNESGFVEGKRTIDTDVTEAYRGRVWVRLFPNEAYARDTVSGKLDAIGAEYGVDLNILSQYQSGQTKGLGLVQRMLGRG